MGENTIVDNCRFVRMSAGWRAVLGSIRASPGKGYMELLLTADALAGEHSPEW